ncbi:hypothetical protein DW972_02055 [Anaerobutyricum hallii]|uniref:Uncharacterized protein n=2 Tax=Anaerobutyricum hallii TaxID=39488 RepID=A0A413Q193_9FIRM|nr:hypothetical protein [Anaerobutyricum hallii]RGZ86145.1 hypothetical protein DW972_02055 [Anaerobutyricum hallii]RHK41198.1 hypothetical protein DW068_02605 [Anaerobutyricum hallii]
MTNETEISLEEIKTILSNYKGLKKQIRNHISDLYDDLMDTDNLIETVSIKKQKYLKWEQKEEVRKTFQILLSDMNVF